MTRILLLAVTALALTLSPAAAGAATWDATGLDISPTYGGSPGTIAIAPTDDGAVWVAWTVDPSGAGGLVDVLARRVSPNGIPGEVRTLLTDGPSTNNASLSIVAVPGGDVRVSYTGAASRTVSVRRLTPAATGAESTLYDADANEDGDGEANNGSVFSQQLLPAPGGASWALIVRDNSGFGGGPVVEARHIAAGGALSTLARPSGATYTYEAAATVDGAGRLLVATAPLGMQGRVAATRVDTNGSLGPEAEVRPSSSPSPPFVTANTPSIGVDGAGMATVGWRVDTPGTRTVEVQRLDTTTTPMTTGGAPVTSLDEDLPPSFVQYGPLLAVDPGGSAIAAWYETDSFTTNNDAMVRGLAAGPLSAPGAVGPRVQLDGPSPEGGSVAAALPGPGGITTVFSYSSLNNVSSCKAARITTTGGLAGTDPLPSSCSYPYTPASAADGLAAAWVTSPPYTVQVARDVTAAPSCSDAAPLTVQAGSTTTLPLACTGWRPVREIVGAPARGTLAAIDQGAGTVAYTAGAVAGTDTVTFRAANAAGVSTTRSVPVTVEAAPSPAVTPPAPAPPVAASADRTRPVVTTLRIKPSKLKLTKLRAPAATFSLSEAATVTITVERLQRGRRVRGRCLPAKRKPTAKAACTKATRISRLIRAAPAGAARATIAVRSGKRSLPSGRYRVTVTAADAAGNRSTPATAHFTIAF